MNARIELTELRLENITKGVGTNKILSLKIFFLKTVNLATLQTSKILIEAGLIQKHTKREYGKLTPRSFAKHLSWYHTTFHKKIDVLTSFQKNSFFKTSRQ